MSVYPISLDIDDYVLLQNTDDYAFSQDSVFLANIAKIGKKDTVLDLGCGTGVLATLAIVKKGALKATGIELQEDIASLALQSVRLNRLEDKLNIINGDVRSIKQLIQAESFDIVLCNPPYFSSGQSSKKSLSRQEGTASLCDFTRAASFALRFGGDAYFVYKVDRLAELVYELKQAQLEPKELTLVYPKPSLAVDVVIVKARKGARVGLITHTLVVMDENGEYTTQYKELYH